MHKVIYPLTAGALAIFASLIYIPSSRSLSLHQLGTAIGSNRVGMFKCTDTPKGTLEIMLRANGYYTLNDQHGKYQAFDRGYRFLTGELRDQSMVITKKFTYYLADTKEEKKIIYFNENNDSGTTCTSEHLYR
jgi:hypothetical protein